MHDASKITNESSMLLMPSWLAGQRHPPAVSNNPKDITEPTITMQLRSTRVLITISRHDLGRNPLTSYS